jgi:Transposase IS116/IS110/IS902 family
VDERIEPFRITVELLTTIPRISELSARIVAAEIGKDMSRFATAAHLISWAGLCPLSVMLSLRHFRPARCGSLSLGAGGRRESGAALLDRREPADFF